MSRLLTLQEVADRLGLGATPRTVYSLPIQSVRLSPRRTRWPEDDVEAYRVAQGIPLAQKVPIVDRRHILRAPIAAPTKPGIYFLVLRGEIVYVGQSINPLARIGQHATALEFDSYVVLPCPLKDLLLVEGAYILALRPRYNRNGL